MSTPKSLTWADGLTRHSIASNAGDIAALAARPSAAARGSAVLVHGFTGSKEDFASLLPALADRGWFALAIDLPGQHESTFDPSAEVSVAALAEGITAAARFAAQNSDGPVHLLGHSLGGIVTRIAVLDHGAAPASLTLMCSGPSGLNDPATRATLDQFSAAMSLGMVDAVWEHLRAEQMDQHPTIDVEVLDWLEYRLRGGHPDVHAALGQQLIHEPDRTDALAATDIPVHVVYGVDDDIWPTYVQDAMATQLSAERTRIENAGHSPAIDDPEATAAALDAWWTAIDESP